MFETAKTGPNKGRLVRLKILVTACIRDEIAPFKRSVSGYGKKIPTHYRVRTIDNRWRRVYCVIYSNVGTLYVMHGKERTIVELPF